MKDVNAVRAHETAQALIYYFSAAPHKHVLHQEASIKEHHMPEVVIADTCHYILVVEAAGSVRDGDNRFIQLLQ
jgi:dethiobiotin synthetase